MVALTKTTQGMLERANELVVERMGSDPWRQLDEIEAVMERLPQQEVPQHHVFTPGIYLRSVFMPAQTLVTSRIHLTEHPFIISAGIVSVCEDGTGWVTHQAPYIGVTKSATRRMLFCHTDVIWSTAHANPEEVRDPDEMMMRLTYCGGKYKSLGGSKSS